MAWEDDSFIKRFYQHIDVCERIKGILLGDVSSIYLENTYELGGFHTPLCTMRGDGLRESLRGSTPNLGGHSRYR